MRNPPFSHRKARALVPLAALVVLTPFTIDAFTARAGADTASDCTAAFTTSPATQLSYTTDPPVRYATIGQTVSLSAGWDPAAWDSVTSAVACVQVNDAVNDVLGGSEAAPADSGAFTHSFTIPADVPAGSVLCARIRLAGDPAGPETEAVWVSNTHCFEVDTGTTDTTAPEATPPVQPQIPLAGESSTTTTAPATSGSDVSAPPSSTPAAETGTPDTGIFSPEGGGSPPGTPVDEAATPPEAAKSSAPRPAVPMLPATGIAARTAIHAGDALFFFGLAFVVLFGRPRRRRRSAS